MLQEQSWLLSLSTELVLLILDLTSNPALISIAKTCRRLYYLALPVYLARYGIACNPVPRSFVLHEKALRALPGLATAIFITSVDDLWCRFQGPEEFYFSRGVKELHRFVHGLSSVSCVSLDVGNIDTRWIDGLATAASDTWKPSFLSLLDTVLERDCKSLTIAHGHFLVAPLLLKKGSRLQGPEAVPERTFLGLPWLPRRKQASNVHVRPGNKLVSFSVHSNMLLSAPFYEWTLQTLHANPITSLSFRVYGLSQDTWSLILNAITLPSLTSFSTETLNIAFPTLVSFLRRHPTITTLNLHPHFLHPGTVTLSKPQSSKRNSLVPSLVALGGSPKNVTALLSHLHADTALRVRELTFVLSMHQRVFHPSDFAALSAQIIDAVKGKGVWPTSLTLRFSVPYETLHPRLVPEEDDSLTVRSVEALLGNVETLTFCTDGHYAFARWVIPRLSAWLGANFVSLENVRLSGDCVAGIDVRGRKMLVQSIRDSCHGMKNVVFGDEEANIL
ncbi:hypothetical protein C0995_003681 [Termitomyces sp. Mi166|nr:hypothetical protein C0995_003681 [Termitomyces sp. Mi166\